ncbi:hypothetical protein [uncultured Sunxiuqinia sp.]|uniref:hypothetical protein n=1 Tax=uncultured Sunxiuqinia sp. TaxID=1573825 RepID=UPI002AA7F92B|nr:hypothetical protein [uncultured Sunxiuqinia sp.]
MKRILLTCTLVLMVLFSFSQRFSVGASIGYGSYSMGSLKDFQAWRVKESNLPLKTTENYPIMPYYRAEIALNGLWVFDKLGVFYAFSSTGGRSTVSDYSGRVNLDALINGNQLGLSVRKDFIRQNNWSAGVYVDGSWLRSSLNAKDYLMLVGPPETVEKDSYDFRATGYSAEPGLALTYKLLPLMFQLNVGYLMDFSGKLYLKDNKKQWLEPDGKEATPEWSGLRAGVQVSFVFGKPE